jgi:hypothetical protein
MIEICKIIYSKVFLGIRWPHKLMKWRRVMTSSERSYVCKYHYNDYISGWNSVVEYQCHKHTQYEYNCNKFGRHCLWAYVWWLWLVQCPENTTATARPTCDNECGSKLNGKNWFLSGIGKWEFVTNIERWDICGKDMQC